MSPWRSCSQSSILILFYSSYCGRTYLHPHIFIQASLETLFTHLIFREKPITLILFHFTFKRPIKYCLAADTHLFFITAAFITIFYHDVALIIFIILSHLLLPCPFTIDAFITLVFIKAISCFFHP